MVVYPFAGAMKAVVLEADVRDGRSFGARVPVC
jgi:hypothetical protein